MASQNLLVLLLLCVMAAVASAANTVSVGSNGWTLQSTIDSVTVSTGDTVRFTYPEGAHNVNMVSEDAYNGCDASSPSATYSSGDDSVAFPDQGTFYFICAEPGHCAAGMKLAVTVQCT